MPPTIGAAMRCMTSEPAPPPHMMGSRPARIVATVIAFGVGYAVIAWLLRYLRTGSYLPFVAYRLALAALIVALLVTGTITAT